jgi:UDP-2,3-diacylglucosamine pyrophosphatase LpxH
MDETYLVVSDLHLGSENCCREEFEHFLEWLAAGSRNGGKLLVQTCGGDRTLSPPTTFILLGDMLELWVPREYERSSVLCDSTSIFSKLIDLSCKKVYVLGNHDADLCEHECEEDGSRDKSFQTLMEWICANDSRFEVVQRHYPNCPDDALKQRVRLGDKDYLFLHGQQFDRDFNTSRGLVRFVPFMAGLASAFDLFPNAGPIFFVLSLAFLVAAFVSHVNVWLLVLFVLAAYPGFSWLIVRLFSPAWELKKTLSAVVALAGQSQNDVLSSPWDVNRNVNSLKHSLYNMKKQDDRPKYKNINLIVTQRYYRPEKDVSKPDVIVFGHTHVPEICNSMQVGEENGKPAMRQFVNSGMWLRPPKQGYEPASQSGAPRCDEEGGSAGNEDSPYNTFVYIDGDGPTLFRWCDRERTAKEIPPSDCS